MNKMDGFDDTQTVGRNVCVAACNIYSCEVFL